MEHNTECQLEAAPSGDGAVTTVTSHQGRLRTKDGVIVTSLSEGLGLTWGFGDGGNLGIRRSTRRMVLQRWASSSGSWRNTPKVAALDFPMITGLLRGTAAVIITGSCREPPRGPGRGALFLRLVGLPVGWFGAGLAGGGWSGGLV